MAREAGYNSKVYLDEFDYSGRSNELEFTIDNTLIPVTCFSEVADVFVEAHHRSALRLNGFFDGISGGYDKRMWDRLADGGDHGLGFYIGQGTPASYGDRGYELLCHSLRQPRRAEIAGAVLLHAEWQGSEPILRSIVHCNGAVTGTGAVANSARQSGVTAAGLEYTVVTRVLGVSGSGSITIDHEESSDNGVGDAYALISGLQDTFTAIGISRKSTTAATEAWKRVNVTAFSGFTSVILFVVAGRLQGVS